MKCCRIRRSGASTTDLATRRSKATGMAAAIQTSILAISLKNLTQPLMLIVVDISINLVAHRTLKRTPFNLTLEICSMTMTTMEGLEILKACSKAFSTTSEEVTICLVTCLIIYTWAPVNTDELKTQNRTWNRETNSPHRPQPKVFAILHRCFCYNKHLLTPNVLLFQLIATNDALLVQYVAEVRTKRKRLVASTYKMASVSAIQHLLEPVTSCWEAFVWTCMIVWPFFLTRSLNKSIL